MRATAQSRQAEPSMIAQTAPSPTPMLDSPSEVIGRARCPVTRAVAGSIREIPPGSQVAVQTAPNPSSVAVHGPCGTATEPSGRPVRASYTPTPLPIPEIHARPWATSVQSASRLALMVAPPALATDWIAGSFGSDSATEDGGAPEVEVVAAEAPVPSPSSEQPATSAASSTTMNRTA